MTSTFAKFGLAFAIVGWWWVYALADGGEVRSIVNEDSLVVTVFTSPNPLRAGPVDVSVLVQDAATGEPIVDADIQVRLAPRTDGALPIHAVATHDEATNQLLQAAQVELPIAGWWDAEVECVTAGNAGMHAARANFSIEAGAPLPHWLAVWPWFGWPVFAVILFAVHRRLAAGLQSQRPTLAGC